MLERLTLFTMTIYSSRKAAETRQLGLSRTKPSTRSASLLIACTATASGLQRRGSFPSFCILH